MVDDAVIADAHAPEISGAAQLLTSRWTRRRLQRIQVPRNASKHGVGQRLELFPGRSDETELVHAGSAGCALLRCGLEPTGALKATTYGRPALRPLAFARAGQCDVEEIFPHVAGMSRSIKTAVFLPRAL